VYFGGGTPTELSPTQLGRVLKALKSTFPIASDAEITLECVANRSLRENLDAYCEQGFNRISFGVQSLDPDVRKGIGRGESVEDYEQLVELLAARPQLPFNVDLMVGLPGQTTDSFANDVRRVSAWGIGSADVYTFWMVPGTRTYEGVMDQRKECPTYGSRLLDFRVTAKRMMKEMGFRPVATEAYVRSDINNFMKSTFGGGGNALSTSLAFGPSAFGFVNGTLHRDVSDLAEYLKLVDQGLLPFQCSETLDLATAQRRAMLMGIQRLSVPRLVIETRRSWRKLAARWVKQGLAVESADSFDLTDWGAVWFNQMQMEVVPLRQQLAMSKMLGSATDQIKAFADDGGRGNGMMREFARALRDGDGLSGDVRMAAYKGYLQLKRLPLFQDHAFNFAGKVSEPAERP
jgi:anaerobilin synthase